MTTTAPPGARPPSSLFRPEVVERLSSPEQLQLLMRVTDGKSWLTLSGCGLALAAVVAWGFLGTVPTRVSGSGILLPVGGLAAVVALSDGQLTSLDIHIGDRVQQGQVIAHLAQPELVGQIEALEKQRGELRLDWRKTRDFGSVDAHLHEQTVSGERARLTAAIAAARHRSAELGERLAGETSLLGRGMISKTVVQGTRDELRASEVEERALRSELKRVALERFSALRARESEVRGNAERVVDVERQIQLLTRKLAEASVVVSPTDGRVVELRATVGEMVRSGSAVASIERGQRELEALIYLDSRDGKLAQPGMTVEVAPTIVKRERHGAILAHVRVVEEFPSTRTGMIQALHNEELVDALRAESVGPPIALRATLEVDPARPGAYRWTSGRGPQLELTSGTRFTAQVVTRRQRPVALLFPGMEN